MRKNIAKLFKKKDSTAPSLNRQLKLLVIGGSLGAKALNEVVPKALSQLPAERRPEVWHQTGRKLITETEKIYQDNNVEARVVPFIDDMSEAYQWADFIICRAGAMTIAEIAIVGLASILVPYPYAVDDHQTSNARYLSDANAAILVQQSELTPGVLLDLLTELDATRISTMANAANHLALPQATTMVADQCMEAAYG